jgi:predicted Zn-dependent peptidase
MPLLVYGTCEPQNLEAVRAAILEELEKLKKEGIKGREMKRIRRQVLNSHLFSLETNAGRALVLGYSQIMLKKPTLMTEYDKVIRDVNEDDIMEIVRKYLNEDQGHFFATTRSNGANGG